MKLFSVLALVAALAAAESVIDYSKVPTCAHQCSILQQAEANCVPPSAPVTNQGIYQSCVCQSTLLSPLKSSGSLCQQAGCSTDDATKISQYYVALCNGPVVTPSSSTTLATTTATKTSTATKKASATAAGVGSNGLTANAKGKSWLSTHTRWVIMIVVMVVGGILITIAAVLTKRHFDRKRDAKRANMAAHSTPYNPSAPASKSRFSNGSSMPPMTMSGGLDGGVGGIASPRRASRRLSRSNTLHSIGLANGSRTTLPEPVIMGPHHRLSTAYRTDSPGTSGPPSPLRPNHGITAPTQVYRNPDALRSEPRFVNHRTTPSGVSLEDAIHQQGVRPHTATGGAFRDGPARSLNPTRNDRVLSPHIEGESAEICEPTPRPSPNKLRRAL